MLGVSQIQSWYQWQTIKYHVGGENDKSFLDVEMKGKHGKQPNVDAEI